MLHRLLPAPKHRYETHRDEEDEPQVEAKTSSKPQK